MRPFSCSAVVAVVVTFAFTVACTPKGTTTNGAGKTGKPAEKGEVIAKIGDDALTVEQIQRRLDEQSPFVRVRYNDPAKKKEFLDSQVRFEVLAAEAFARGMDKDPEVVEATKKIIVQKLTREEFDNRVKLQDVNDDDLKKYFDAHQADYQKAAMVRASDIVVAFGNDKAAAKKKADEAQKKAALPSKLEDRNAFKDLVTTYSTDEATKRAGGDLRYMTADEVEQRMGGPAKAWLMSGETVNEVSPVIEGKDNAWHVFKRTAMRKEISRDFAQVKNQIKNVVFREKRTEAFNAYIEELKKKHAVTVFENKLDKVKVNAQMPQLDAAGNPVPPHGAQGGHDPHGAPPMDDGDVDAKEKPGDAPKPLPDVEAGEGK